MMPYNMVVVCSKRSDIGEKREKWKWRGEEGPEKGGETAPFRSQLFAPFPNTSERLEHCLVPRLDLNHFGQSNTLGTRGFLAARLRRPVYELAKQNRRNIRARSFGTIPE